MFRNFIFAASVAIAAAPAYAISFDEAYPDIADQLTEEDRALVQSLDFITGDVVVGGNLATLSLDGKFFYLNPADTAHVLQKIWGNPPSDGGLGMVFPVESSPLHSSGWGMELWFEDIGYVDDKDAQDQDYDAILKDLQAEVREANEWRQENGYESLRLIGWAEDPTYDPEARVVYWAKELEFGGSPDHTLNFNMRVLGRKGVLVQNFIASMDELPSVKNALPSVIAMTEFNEGHRYADFNPSMDTVAAVGVGGLVAGKVLTKTGFLAAGLLLLKKFWFVLLLPLIWLKNLFTRKQQD
ncbi:Uncharacterized membrane-anchored protein [Aliiroseovarius halocynthiae]|uniref:DUF2167 domain-containing protein n=2 Tax=Aliiroseovarius halocynthiae TaxID=985055 RepID=A0A545SPN5_9RHOB|nr:DUF2167 domain-containing protein [Aliiroseovarius halocynthiae]TQV66826.1 DUF2167 domain-containing protein [Aliiroseovarius halocynthiae]SMR82337.1 Uncharacterized membrane-anchored protein [Aliiroseovarius halocynthiae]